MDNRRAMPEPPENEGSSKKNRRGRKKSSTPVLDNFGKDLTELARKGKLDAVIGRDEEINKLIQILSKTAIVEGLAQRIVDNNVDSELLNKRIIELNFTNIVGGTKFRGQFEERMKAVLEEVYDNDEVIVFIDEIHNIIGAGGATGSMDAANLLKPSLSRGEFRCIGATTFDEYKKTVAKEGALERRFQKVIVNTPTEDETLQILSKIRPSYQEYHGVIYTDDVLKKCVDLSGRYITDRNFPDKAIDLMDEVGARVKLNHTVVPEKIIEFENKIKEIEEKKDEAKKTQDYESAARYRDEQIAITEKIEKERAKWKKESAKLKITVTEEDVAGIISNHTGIPLNRLTDSENNKLASMEEDIKAKVIGQDDAVKKIVEAIQRSRLGIQDPDKPMASFLFLGSTGVGKTHLTKVLSKYMFNREDAIVRFDMSEYMDSVSTSKLIGSSPGYVGYEEGGQLTEKIKNQPYSIILFDEVEKAHPDVFNTFLQLLDEGRLSDNFGDEVNFRNTIIIMTSNIGTSKILQEKKLGFASAVDDYKNMSEVIDAELKKFFRPELLNRIDEKVIFKPLSE
jgi:ATP-dependent Clp protease ATP-binding subunit ClpC